MVSPAARLRKICRRICRQIFREHPNPSLPFPARPRGQVSGVASGTYKSPPKPSIEDLTDKILYRLSTKNESRELGAGVIARLRDLVGDLPASADHHHSEPYGLLRHSLEVALKMLGEFEGTLIMEKRPDGSVDCFQSARDRPRWQYMCFLAALCHDLGKLLDMDVREGERRWWPLAENYAAFYRKAKTRPVLRWRKDRVRGGHALLSPLVLHQVLTAADVEYLGRERFVKLCGAIAGTHSGDQATPLGRLLSTLDQKNVEEAAPDWMTKRPDSKVNQFVRALRTMIENGSLGVNYLGARVYVTGDKAAVVVPLAIQLARDLLKEERVTLPGNIHLYDLLRQARLVEADDAGQCVRRIKVPGKHGPVELSALIFATDTIVPKQLIAKLPNIVFEIKPEPKQADPLTTSDEVKRRKVADPLA
jgi:hypothetical protein